MPRASKNTASRVEDMGIMEGRYEELGGYTVGFETFRENADAAPLMKGLPNFHYPASLHIYYMALHYQHVHDKIDLPANIVQRPM